MDKREIKKGAEKWPVKDVLKMKTTNILHQNAILHLRLCDGLSEEATEGKAEQLRP